LRSFQAAQLAYDLTVRFCDRWVSKFSRTHDQMVQAARSGVQNIAEGSKASGTSKKMELKLTNVARASLEELLLDYEDYLRQRGLSRWGKDEPRTLALRRRLSGRSDQSDQSDLSDLSDLSDEEAANLLICLINQASYLLGGQIRRLEADFLRTGGITERLYTARVRARGGGGQRNE
jgi:four helix bundle suffix protein